MEGLSESHLLMKNEGNLSSRLSQFDEESATDLNDSQLRCTGTSGDMVRNVGTSQSFLQGTSEGANQNMLRRSFDFPSNTLDLYVNNQRSLSDSELEMTSYDVSDMSSEFLDLPTRVSIKPHSSYRHRIDPEKLYLDLKKVKLEHSRHSNESSLISAPKIEFTPVDVVINTDDVENDKRSDLFIDNDNIDNDIDSNYEGDYVSRASTNIWINLDTPSHALLSPRSSNGSICSYRSSNADSAIEVLTPDEELSEHSPIDLSHTKLWEEKHKSRLLGRTRDIWDTSMTGAKLNAKTADPTQEDNSVHMCSQPFYRRISSSHYHENSSSALNNPLLTQRINANATNLPSKEESNKGREPSLPCPPSVIISDFSNENLSVKTSQTSTSLIHTSRSQGELLEDPTKFFHRSLSNSSISSTESFLSIQSDSSQDVDEPTEFPIKVAKKQSSWKKIRNIVHWSPFIQQFKRRRYPWIQLAGHQGNFQAGGPGAILKKLDKKEHRSFNKLMNDVLRPYVPEYRGESEKDGECYIQLQDLLCDFEAPCVMDIKMGCRTYLEEELSKAREKPTLRGDMYKKMIEVDPKEPTEEEHNQKAITKPRYMQWRDDMSSTSEMGFRIEGIRKSDGAQVKNFKTTKNKASVKSCLKQFVEENPDIINKYLRRLKAIRATQEDSPFFKSSEIIGSSLLFVHDRCGQACIWMIDFGKTVPLPESVNVNHRNKWIEGNHEDGYLTGIDSLINIFEELEVEYKELSANPMPSVEQESTDSKLDSKCDDSEHSDKIASNHGSSDSSDKTASNHGKSDHSDTSVAGYHREMEVDHKNNESIV